VFDHVTLRVADLATAEQRFQRVLDELAMDETFSSRTFAMWEDFALTVTDDEHPVTQGAHVAFAAPSDEAVGAFRQAAVDGGLQADGASVLDEAGNRFEAVLRNDRRRAGNIERVALRVADLSAAEAFYRTIAEAAALDLERLDLVAGPPTRGLHIAFPGPDDAVHRFYEAAIAAGHRGNGEPGERPRYHPGYYAAYVLDPDGNNIEVVNHAHTA
jgi:catechol 2,3-dioxygenase-like lactoylglutathione lyase family enzyme